MKLEDYSKYYIQGSDHYLIPKNIFEELFDEMSNWKEESQKQKEVIDRIYNETKELEQENKHLDEVNCKLRRIRQLEDNWNKLKEYLNYKSERAIGEDEYVYDEIYNEMQELEPI